MQERRTLAYIDKDDIPSSAVEVTSSNYSSTYGNVLYIPTYLTYTGNMTYTFPDSQTVTVNTCDGIHLVFRPENNTQIFYEYNNIETSHTSYTSNGLNITLPYITKTDEGYYYYGGLYVSGTNMGYLSSNLLKLKIGHEAKPYIKLKASQNLLLYLTYRYRSDELVNGNSNQLEEFIPKLPPIYIDNE